MKHDQFFWKHFFKNQQSEIDPVSRLMEILFGLIMVLTFTLTISVTNDGRPEVKDMLTGALGCNLAWGIIDAVMFLLSVILLRGRAIELLNAVRRTKSREEACNIISNSIQPIVSELMSVQQLESLYDELMKLPAPPKRAPIIPADLMDATKVFLLVFLSTFPVALPFIFIHEPIAAKHVSNAVALALLFAGGYTLGKYSGYRPWGTGLVMILLGAGLSVLALKLGG